jgi:hypothetical protein
MEILVTTLKELKSLGCSGIKISFEDEGALHNEVISMRKLTAEVGIELSVKIGGCEAKRDIVDCMDLDCDTIVAPMIESEFALKKFLKSLDSYKCDKKKGFNLETIQAYENLDTLSKSFDKVDFVTVGRVDFVGSLGKDRNFVDTDEMYKIVKDIFTSARSKNTMCYVGGAVSINSKDFISKLIAEDLLDKFETRYIIYDVHQIDMNNFEKLLYLGNVFEVEWLKYISSRYFLHANKDVARIKMIEERIAINKKN